MDEIEYFNLCAKHDWDYYFSDDNRKIVKGDATEKRLESLAKENPKFAKIYKAWNNWHNDQVNSNKFIPQPTIEDINAS